MKREWVKSLLNYKKPAFWVGIIAVAACVALIVWLLVDPQPAYTSDKSAITGTVSAAECDDITYEYVSGSLSTGVVSAEWENNTDDTLCFGTPFTLYYYGKVYEPKEPMGFDDVLWTVAPGGSFTEEYFLTAYDLQDGAYRLEKTFYLQSDPDTTYTAYIEFVVNETYAFVGVNYVGEAVIYDAGRYSSILFTDENIPRFYVDDSSFFSLVTDLPPPQSEVSSYYVTDALFEETLTAENFDQTLQTEIWKEGYSASLLREQNRKAFKVDDRGGWTYWLLEQKNGDIYIAIGAEDIRWIFKMKAEEETVSSLPRGELPNSVPWVVADEQTIARAREKYPQFFDLDTSAGLIVSIWQPAAGKLRCYLESAQTDAVSDTSFAYTTGVSYAEMRVILSAYDLSKKDITVRAVKNPLSSYAYTIDEQYVSDVTAHFWGVWVDKYDLVLDTATFDIDGDGKAEQCTLRPGPTSGVYSCLLTVAERGSETYTLYWGVRRIQGFGQNDGGETVLVSETSDGEITHIRMRMSDGAVALLGEEGDDKRTYTGSGEFFPAGSLF